MVAGEDLLFVEDAVWVLAARTGIPIYDFDLARFFACRRPWERPTALTAVARTGAFEDYASAYGTFMTPSWISDDGLTFYWVMSQFGPYNTYVMKAQLKVKG